MTNNGVDSSNSTASTSWRPLGWALASILYFAAAYEPVRQMLLHGQSRYNVGGVGGIGGLANLDNPDKCTNYDGQFCYEVGTVGPFTPFAAMTLVFWVGPLLVACLMQYFHGSRPEGTTMDVAATPAPANSTWLTPVWIGVNLLWFALPYATFGLGLREIEPAWAKNILAISLGACHPLSWNLSLVVIPTGGILSQLLVGSKEEEAAADGRGGNEWFVFHRLLGYTTVFWGMIHGLGEFIYLASTKERLRDALFSNGESLLYWAGICSFLLLLAQGILAYGRRYFGKPRFQRLHASIAAALLLMAAVHWAPFALLFIPSTSIHGITFARRWSSLPSSLKLSMQRASLLLALSLVASLCGLTLVWWLRQENMMRPTANLFWPFFFPPLSVLVSTLASFGVSVAVLSIWNDNPVSSSATATGLGDVEDTPLLSSNTTMEGTRPA